jgi:hypothetical protein
MSTIRTTYKKTLRCIILATAVLLPSSVQATTHESEPSKLENPLQADNLQDFLGELVGAIVYLSIPVIVFFIIYAGFLFVTSGGNTGKIETAQKTALYTVIGAGIILGARLISVILEGTVDNFGS